MPKLIKLFAVMISLFWCVSLVAQQKSLDPTVDASPYQNSGTITGEDVIWDVLFTIDVTAISGAAGNAGAEFANGMYYTTRWNSNLIHEYDMTGALVREFSVPGVSGLRDLAYDGTYFYGGASTSTIYQMDFGATPTLIGSFNVTGGITVRNIAYDSGADGFWCGNWDDPVTLFDRSGNQLDQIATGLDSQYGSAYDNVSPGGPFLWVFDQNAGVEAHVHQFDIASGTATGVTHNAGPDATDPTIIAGGLWTSTDHTPGFLVMGGLGQGVPDELIVWEIAPAGGGTITIAEAIEDLNGDFVPDRLGQTVTVEGVVFSPNFQTTNNSFYIDDGTAGTDIFMFGPPLFTWAMGDMLEITGEVDQFSGMTEIIPADSSGWVFVIQ